MATAPDWQRELQRAMRDGVYVTVGLGLIAFQRAQVQRRELETRVDAVLDDVEDRLPGQAGAALSQLRSLDPRRSS